MSPVPQDFVLPTLLFDYYEDRLERGRSMLEARDDTLVWASLFGSRLFQRCVDVLRDAGKVLEFENIYYGGPTMVGVMAVEPGLPYRERYFEISRKDIETSGCMLDNMNVFEPGVCQPQKRFWSKILAPPRMRACEIVEGDELALCRFCLTALLPNEDCLVLPCGHWYCASCVSVWLRVKDNCPECCSDIIDHD